MEGRKGPDGFTPKRTLVRSPQGGSASEGTPQGGSKQGAPQPAVTPAEKRALTSPEESQPASRLRLANPAAAVKRTEAVVARRSEAAAVKRTEAAAGEPAGTAQPQKLVPEEEEEGVMETDQEQAGVTPQVVGDKVALLDRVHKAVAGIIAIATGPGSKLNKADVTGIGAFGHEILAAVGAVEIRLAEAEKAIVQAKLETAEAKLSLATSCPMGSGLATEPPSRPVTFASALKLPQRAEPVPIGAAGPSVAFYPGEEGTIKTAEETKAELKKSIDPTKIWVQVTKMRKVGNAGVVVQTTSEAAAARLKEAAPTTLRVTEPKRRQPLVCLNRLEGNPSYEDVLKALHDQNFKGDEAWPLERMTKEAKGAFKKSRAGGAKTAAIFSCSLELREALLAKGEVYIGWQVVEVTDYIDVTCCSKCQQYGHPERYCRAAEVTCGRCGETGHKHEDCKAMSMCCATCKRFGRKEAGTHRTAARDCPARMHAEQRSISMTQYG